MPARFPEPGFMDNSDYLLGFIDGMNTGYEALFELTRSFDSLSKDINAHASRMSAITRDAEDVIDLRKRHEED